MKQSADKANASAVMNFSSCAMPVAMTFLMGTLHVPYAWIMPVIFLIALATLVGIISFLPGGIGSMEVSLLFILGLQGVSGPIAVSGLLLARFLSIWYVVFLGLMSLIYLGRKFDLKQVFR